MRYHCLGCQAELIEGDMICRECQARIDRYVPDADEAYKKFIGTYKDKGE